MEKEYNDLDEQKSGVSGTITKFKDFLVNAFTGVEEIKFEEAQTLKKKSVAGDRSANKDDSASNIKVDNVESKDNNLNVENSEDKVTWRDKLFNLFEKDEYTEIDEELKIDREYINIENPLYSHIIYHSLPCQLSESAELVDKLKRGESILINLEDLKRSDRAEFVAYVKGAVFGLNGSMKSISKDVLLCSPKKILIDY